MPGGLGLKSGSIKASKSPGERHIQSLNCESKQLIMYKLLVSTVIFIYLIFFKKSHIEHHLGKGGGATHFLTGSSPPVAACSALCTVAFDNLRWHLLSQLASLKK